MPRSQEDRESLFSAVPTGRAPGNRYRIMKNSTFKQGGFHCDCGQTLQEASQFKSRLSILGNAQTLAGQPALAYPALNKG